jgi:predicted component of type VI protein secretion system
MKELSLHSRWLNGPEGSDLNQSIAITHFPAVVGRGTECDYQICHPLISRRHCAFDLRDGEIWVQDLGSLNGTYLNGDRVKGPQPVHDGDRLDLTFLPYDVSLSPEASVDATEAALHEVLSHSV